MDEDMTYARNLGDGTRVEHDGAVWTAYPETEIAGASIRWHSDTGLASDRGMDTMLDDGAQVLPDTDEERAARVREFNDVLAVR